MLRPTGGALMGDLEQFSVFGDWTGQVFISCNAEEPYWCFWEAEVPAGASLTEVLKIGIAHRDRTHVPKGLCARRDEHEPHIVSEGSLASYWCTADQLDREPTRSERRRS